MSASAKPKKAGTPKPQDKRPDITMTGCSIQFGPNDGAVEALAALARAAESNAQAIRSIAEVLKVPPGPNYGIFVEGPRV